MGKQNVDLTFNMETGNSLFPVYLGCYQSATMTLLDQLPTNNSLIIPCTFCLAHYMELWIKMLVIYAGLKPKGQSIRALKLASHDVRKLIEENKDKASCDGRIDAQKIDAILNMYVFFERYACCDLSEAMRFPVRKDDSLSINDKEIIVDAQNNFTDYILKAHNLLTLTSEYTKMHMKNQFGDLFHGVQNPDGSFPSKIILDL